MPVRIQRKRIKGWRMPANTVYVGRPTLWGNPVDWQKCSRKKAVSMYREILRRPIGIFPAIQRAEIKKRLHELKGKNLACWCPLDEPCHADVLLKLANK